MKNNKDKKKTLMIFNYSDTGNFWNGDPAIDLTVIAESKSRALTILKKEFDKENLGQPIENFLHQVDLTEEGISSFSIR
jgi:hypothetical protein